MTTKSGSRVYRRAPKPLAPGACAQCGRVITVSPSGRRRSHIDSEGRPCPGGRVFVGESEPVFLDDLPDVVMPVRRGSREDDPRLCTCGWRPRRKKNGDFAAHRIDPEDPSAPYCPNGSAKARP